MLQQVLSFLNTNSSALTAISVLTAGIVWLLRILHARYRKEITAISKLERLFIFNEIALRDNIKLMEDWEKSLLMLHPYSCHFEPMIIDKLSTHSLSNLKLIKEIVEVYYKMKRSRDDLGNLYTHYWEAFPHLEKIDLAEREKNLRTYHDKVLTALRRIKQSTQLTHTQLVPVLAHIQVLGVVRKHSLFGYLNLLNVDVIPRPTEKKVAKQAERMKEKMSSLNPKSGA